MNAMYYLVLFLLAVIIFYLFRLMLIQDRSYTRERRPLVTEEEKLRPCPLCGELLKKNEKVHSVLYSTKTDNIMEIYGCPYCYPPGQGKNKRICPSCKSELGDKDFVSARMFEKPGKKHVHVNGCPKCRKRIH